MRGSFDAFANGLICVLILGGLYLWVGFEGAALIGIALVYGEAAAARRTIEKAHKSAPAIVDVAYRGMDVVAVEVAHGDVELREVRA